MMRTPWRFVADLVSRKPKPHSFDESREAEAKTIALEYKPAPKVEQPVIDATTVDRPAEPVSEAQVEASRPEPDTNSSEAETATSVATDAPAVAVGDGEPTSLAGTQQAEKTPTPPPRTEASKTTTKAASTRRKRAAPAVEPVIPIYAASEKAPVVAAGPKSFIDEIADLDAEVAALRRQLAKKLVEQNAQLRKMLTRFDRR